mgnify:CR=1 FL=1
MRLFAGFQTVFRERSLFLSPFYLRSNRAYQGEELVWEKWHYNDVFWVENINDYPVVFSVNKKSLIGEKITEKTVIDVK